MKPMKSIISKVTPKLQELKFTNNTSRSNLLSWPNEISTDMSHFSTSNGSDNSSKFDHVKTWTIKSPSGKVRLSDIEFGGQMDDKIDRFLREMKKLPENAIADKTFETWKFVAENLTDLMVHFHNTTYPYELRENFNETINKFMFFIIKERIPGLDKIQLEKDMGDRCNYISVAAHLFLDGKGFNMYPTTQAEDRIYKTDAISATENITVQLKTRVLPSGSYKQSIIEDMAADETVQLAVLDPELKKRTDAAGIKTYLIVDKKSRVEKVPGLISTVGSPEETVANQQSLFLREHSVGTPGMAEELKKNNDFIVKNKLTPQSLELGPDGKLNRDDPQKQIQKYKGFLNQVVERREPNRVRGELIFGEGDKSVDLCGLMKKLQDVIAADKRLNISTNFLNNGGKY